jgi:hypothetical protein
MADKGLANSNHRSLGEQICHALTGKYPSDD